MYNVVDSFYAGRISTQALAALGLSFPVYLLIIATGGGLSRGASALIANAIGAGESEKQELYVAQSLSMAGLLSVLLTIIGLVIAQPLFVALGASGEYLAAAMEYMHPIFLGAIFFVTTSLCNAILIASGDSKTFGKVLVVGFFLNLILDPWFLYGGFGLPAMGIAGIAWATVIIQIGSSIFMFSTVTRRGLLNLSSWRVLLPRVQVYLEIAQQALPASFHIMSVAMGSFATTYFLNFYDEATVASFGVTTRIEQIGLLPTFGLYAAIMALAGQNNGAGKIDRVNETLRVCNRYGLILAISCSTIMFLMAGPLMKIFSDDPEVIGIGVTCLRIFAFVEWAYVMKSTHTAMLQAIKRPMYGFFEAVTRKIILPMPLFWLFIDQWGKGIEWIWYTSAITTVLVTIVTMVYTRSLIGKRSEAAG